MSPDNRDNEFEDLLQSLKRARGFDFTGYKRSSLMRRILKRMQTVGIAAYRDYQDHLEVHPEEFAQLFNTILINVTAFFRDMPYWAYLKEEILPRIAAQKGPQEPLRVWVAGCSSGEEAYTIAMVLAEVLGEEVFREQVKVYATDADEEALTQARQAAYDPKTVQDIPPDLLEKYFEQINQRYIFHKDIRRAVIFGRHDLVQDAPISRIDLLICRNTLMYFNAETQARILIHFNFALNNEGFLFLGKSEMLLTHANLFTPIDLPRRVFAKVPRNGLRDRLSLMTQNSQEETVNPLINHVRIRDAAFDAAPIAQIVVDLNGCLAAANQQARLLFGLVPRDLGRPLQDLELSYRPVELRSRIEQAYAERRPILLKEVEWPLLSHEFHYLDVQILPVMISSGSMQGVSITFADVTPFHRLQIELQNSKQELETAYEELQSTVEELETTNEELQSTNEELETMNEELQSTNEELETMNDELRLRTTELNQVNGFLESILTSLRVGIVVLDRDLQIQIWNYRSEDLWGLRADEVQGQNFLNLDIGLPVVDLKTRMRACLTGEAEYQETQLKAINRRGKAIECHVTCTPLTAKGEGIRGVILWIEEQETEPN